jgi:hypothetical protein
LFGTSSGRSWGLVGSANVGAGGVKAGVGSFGIGELTGSKGPSYEPWPGLWHQAEMKAVFVHTWGTPLGLQPGVNLVGGEVEYLVQSMFSVNVGVLFPLDATPTESSVVLSWGIGVRLPLR